MAYIYRVYTALIDVDVIYGFVHLTNREFLIECYINLLFLKHGKGLILN